MIQNILEISYLIASVTFILGLQMMSHPKSARRGNLVAAVGMTIAILGTIFLYENNNGLTTREPVKLGLIFAAILVGTIIGWVTAKKVKMTKMPELVSMFNGMGGACAALIGLMEYHHNIGKTGPQMAVVLGMIIGSVSFSGSVIAFLKLNGTMGKPIRLPKYNILNTLVLIGVLAFGGFMIFGETNSQFLLYLLFAAALVYGIMFVIPIGGADMPVVISLLNSFTGLAAAFGGFLYGNKVMLTGGILVGSAGTLLTIVMCKAMNRPLWNVIFGAFGQTSTGDTVGSTMSGSIKDVTVNDAAVLMNYSKKVIIVPGYGLAVAQAQHVIHELENILVERGVEVKYAIHPVAGRMPGHMNVLLAESNVDYGKLSEMEEVNP